MLYYWAGVLNYRHINTIYIWIKSACHNEYDKRTIRRVPDSIGHDCSRIFTAIPTCKYWISSLFIGFASKYNPIVNN